jgi:hypothetical protein
MENQIGNLGCLGEVKLPVVPTGVKGLKGAELGAHFKSRFVDFSKIRFAYLAC